MVFISQAVQNLKLPTGVAPSIVTIDRRHLVVSFMSLRWRSIPTAPPVNLTTRFVSSAVISSSSTINRSPVRVCFIERPAPSAPLECRVASGFGCQPEPTVQTTRPRMRRTPRLQSQQGGRRAASYQIASTAFARRSRTWPATAVSSAFSIACIDATGSMALTSTPPSTWRRITLQGSIAPTRGSIPIA